MEENISGYKAGNGGAVWTASGRDGPGPTGPACIGVLLSEGREQKRDLSKSLQAQGSRFLAGEQRKDQLQTLEHLQISWGSEAPWSKPEFCVWED